MKHRLIIATAIIGAFSAAFSVAQSRPSVGINTTNARVNLVASNNIPIENLDPGLANSNEVFQFVRQVYEGLTEYAPGSPKIRPLLATKWVVSNHGRTYTFTLRRRVKFQDGTSFNAAAAKQGLSRIKGINQGPATLLTNVKKVSAPSPYTLRIDLKQADAYFTGRLPKLGFVSPAAIQTHKSKHDPWAMKWFAKHSDGTGPYELVSYEPNVKFVLKRNPHYWRPFASGSPTDVTLRYDASTQTGLEALSQGAVDMMDGQLGPSDIAAASRFSGVSMYKGPSYSIDTMPLNVSKGPLRKLKVREAIALAFDYRAMRQYYKGYATATNGPLATDLSPALRSLPTISQNLAKAKKLLRQAGYPKGFSLTFASYSGYAPASFGATVLQSDLAKLGIKLKTEFLPYSQVVALEKNLKTAPNIGFLVQSPISNDPTTMIASSYATNAFPRNGGYNWSYYSNHAVDVAMTRLPTIQDTVARTRALVSLDKRV